MLQKWYWEKRSVDTTGQDDTLNAGNARCVSGTYSNGGNNASV